MPDQSPERQQALRRRHQHERQAVVFGSLVAALAVAGLGSTAIYTGVISVPFLDRDFSSPPPDPDAVAVFAAPCPPEGTLPVAYGAIQAAVLNGSGRTGLAAETAADLAARGFVVSSTGNYPATLTGSAQSTFGEAGLAAAYTLASQVDTPVLRLDLRTDATIDLVLGEQFAGLVDPATITIDPTIALAGVAGCVPLEEARADAAPAPVPSPTATPTDEPLQDGGEDFTTDAPATEG
ncbi:MAG: LytR C-terminal domain-containing protein [Cellulomonadaceae bacterium]|nr:LytR C-terminal domain-containing protein [Cellulomonadaceae bacterium]